MMPAAPLPFTVIFDTREQLPFLFTQPLRIGTKSFAIQAKRATLKSGDYSIEGFEDKIAIERKGICDFFNTLGQGRARFTRELERLATYTVAVIVVEAEWSTIWTQPPARSRMTPKSIMCSVIAWQQRYPRVSWVFLPGRDVAEAYTVLVLERFWRDMEIAARATPTQTTKNQQPGKDSL